MTKVNTLFGSFDEEQLKKLKGYIDETVLAMNKIHNQKLALKDIISAAHDDFKIPKKILRKMATIQMKQNFQEEVAEYKEFEALYVGMTETK